MHVSISFQNQDLFPNFTLDFSFPKISLIFSDNYFVRLPLNLFLGNFLLLESFVEFPIAYQHYFFNIPLLHLPSTYGFMLHIQLISLEKTTPVSIPHFGVFNIFLLICTVIILSQKLGKSVQQLACPVVSERQYVVAFICLESRSTKLLNGSN
ncbi:hypothetical protein A4A49_12138 [Nicotiana attenuata]|uniref:Uncharacterized protein n=1 Tax=Nicotiana attenuata TaxID=49451 RepID=A0A1J6IRD9_NICAT|nr:hypothetical protein A4A49_12138 [Nicotiana attenuata]